MAIVTISRGSLAATRKVAELVAEKLRYPLVTRENVLQKAFAPGQPVPSLEQQQIREEGVLAQAMDTSLDHWLEHQASRRHYLAIYRKALCELLENGNLIYHGNLAHLLLEGAPLVVRVLLTAPMEYRVKAVMADLGLDAKAAA